MDDRSHFQIPTKLQIPREIFGLYDAAKLFFNYSKLESITKGNGETVIVLPGYATDDFITTPLRKFISNLGYNCMGWGLGTNHGNVPILLEQMNDLIQKTYSITGSKIKLVGWSLGGFLARETARDNQDLIDRVITLGSPIVGEPKYTSIAKKYAEQYSIDVNKLEKEIDERYNIPLTIPVYSIFSKSDNIVSWQACIDHYSLNAKNFEIQSTHIGLIANYDSYRYIGESLI